MLAAAPVRLSCALRMPDGRIFTGRTHVEAMQRLMGECPGFMETLEDIAENPSLDSPDDGFVDGEGRFLSRDEAAALVRNLLPEGDDLEELHSCHLHRSGLLAS